jgi:hypothetical protein
MHDLLLSNRFRNSWAMLSRSELSPEDRTAAMSGVIRLLASHNVTLDDLLDCAVRGCAPRRPEEPATRAAAETAQDAASRPRKGFGGLAVEVAPSDETARERDLGRRAETAYAKVGETILPEMLTGTVLIDDDRSNPRAAIGVVTIVSELSRFGPVMVYGVDLDAARDAVNRRSKVEGRLIKASNPDHLPTLTEVRMVA